MKRHKVGRERHAGRAIGIDLGATAVRVAVLASGSAEDEPPATLAGLGGLPLPAGAVVNGVVTDQTVVTGAVKRLWRENGFHGRRVILGIANRQLLVREMQMPDIEPRLRQKALPFQAREIVALPMEQVVLDFIPVGPRNPETKLVPGLLIATPKQPVLDAVAAVERAGIRVARVDLSSFAALRCIAEERRDGGVVIDLGAQLTTIVIHHRGIPKLVRTVAQGGEELTARLADTLDVSTADAERLKCASGLTSPDPAVTGALELGIRPLLAEIRSSINYFTSANEGVRPDRIWLTGGSSALPGLAGMLTAQLGMPAEVVDPMRHVGVPTTSALNRRHESGQMASAVSIGLAMGAAT